MRKHLLLFFLFCFTALGTALGQNITVKGTVLDENSDPVIGATVRVKEDAKKGALTDMDGRFTIEVRQGQTLIVSYVGYQTQEVKPAATLTIRLVPDNELLEEVVVTAMGITRTKKSIGYAAQEIKAEELTKTRVTDVNNALVGKVAGIRFVGGSGSNFDAGSIYLRGTSSLYSSKGSEPLYVIDGVISNKNALNMDDVESINVLKGPAATSLYGSEGGNGAIIITTKKAKEGQSQINISHTTQFEMPVVHAKVQKLYGGGYYGADGEMDVYHYAEGDPSYLNDPRFEGKRFYDYGDDASWGPKFDGEPYLPYYAWDPTDPRFGQTAPWEFGLNLEDLFRTGTSNTTNVAFSKAGKGYSTRISFTNSERQGVNYNSDAIRRYLSVNSAFDVTDNLKVSIDWKYTYHQNHNTASEGYGDFGSILQEFLQWGNTNVKPSDLKAYDRRPDGSFPTWNITAPWDLFPTYHDNPFAQLNYSNRYMTYQWNVIGGNVDYKIIDGLNVGVNVFANLRTSHSETKHPKNFIVTESYSTSQDRTINLREQIYAKYSGRFFEDKLTFDAMLMGEDYQTNYDYLTGYTRSGMFLDEYWNLASSNAIPQADNSVTKTRSRSFLGTATLGYIDTYYLDFNLRNDWVSTLHPDHNSFLYGGASASVLLSNIIKADWLNYWKIRGSFAQVGSTLSAYGVYETFPTGLKYDNRVTQSHINTLLDPNIQPTISTSYEVGTEWAMFNHRFTGDLNFYRKDASNQIIDKSITPATGYTYKRMNAGLIRNEGIELTLGFVPVQTKDFVWNINFNLAHNRNTLIELGDPNIADEEYQLAWMGFSTRVYSYAREGQPIGIIRGNTWARNENGELLLTKVDGIGLRPQQDPDLMKDLGIAQPDLTGGLSTSFDLKGFTFSASLDFSIGGEIASVTNMWGEGSGILEKTAATNSNGKNIRDALENGGGLDISGVDAKTGEPVSGFIDGRYFYETRQAPVWGAFVYDASYVKLRELSLGYRFSQPFLKKYMKWSGLTGASLSLVANNLWLIYSGAPNFDPSEVAGSYGGYLETGQAVSTRSIGFTVNLTF